MVLHLAMTRVETLGIGEGIAGEEIGHMHIGHKTVFGSLRMHLLEEFEKEPMAELEMG